MMLPLALRISFGDAQFDGMDSYNEVKTMTRGCLRPNQVRTGKTRLFDTIIERYRGCRVKKWGKVAGGNM